MSNEVIVAWATWDGKDCAAIQMLLREYRVLGVPITRFTRGQPAIVDGGPADPGPAELFIDGEPVPVGSEVTVDLDGCVFWS